MMKWKKRTIFLLVTAVILSAAVAACIFFIPPGELSSLELSSIRKRLEKREKPATTTDKSSAFQKSNRGKTDNTICEECTVAGARMIKYMNHKKDPCEDFYEYSCGNFAKHQSMPEKWDLYGARDVNSEEIDLTLKSILEERDTINQSDPLAKAKMVYKTCIDKYVIDKDSVNDLKDVLSNTGVGEWPFLDPDWNDCRLDIEWRMAKLNAMGLDSLFHLEVKFGVTDPNKLYAVLRPAEPLVDSICDDPIPYNITLLLEERASEHRKMLVDVLEQLDVNINNVTDQDIDDLFEFDFHFCNAVKESMLKGPVQDVYTLNMTLSDLAAVSPQINWMRWQSLIFTELNLGFPHNKQYIFVDGVESAIDGINHLLQKTSSKVQANYLAWRFVLHHLGFLSQKFRDISKSNAVLLGSKLSPLQTGPDRWIQDRWRQCVLLLKNLMPLALVRPYSDHIQMEPRKEEMTSVISMITDEFKDIMSNYKHLKPSDRGISSHMIEMINERSFLTYPFKKERFFNNFYKDAGIRNDSFLKNGLKLRLRHMKSLLEGTFEEKNVGEMEYTIQTIYPPFGPQMYSFFRGKRIVISLGALQYCPVKGVPLPKFLSLSTFGWMYSHELAHGFDLKSLDRNSEENWYLWPKYVLKNATDRAKCFLKQYPSTYNMSMEEALETTTLNEDLVDQQALLLAHRAYIKYLNESTDNQTLPNIRLLNKELFFVSYAQQFCELRRSGDSYFATNSDRRKLNGHSTTSSGRRRVNEVLRNYVPFAGTFNCTRDKPMNKPMCESLWT